MSDSPVSTEVLPSENLSKNELILNKTGATFEAACVVAVEALNAKITRYDRDGDFVDERPDYNIRLKSAALIAQWHGITNLPLEGGTKNLHQTYVWLNQINSSNSNPVPPSRLPDCDTL